MASPPLMSGGRWFAAFILLLFVSQACHGFFIPRNNKHIFSEGDLLMIKVNSLTSVEAQLPFSYYSLPYCIPPGGIKKSAQNLGQILMGDQILNSPYRLRMNVNESLYLCTTPPLNFHQVKWLKQRSREMYQVNMMLDGLPLLRYARWNGITIQWTGFPVGFTSSNNDDYLINHLKFRVRIHEHEEKDGNFQQEIIGVGEEGFGVIQEAGVNGYEIVGVEVVPCSIKYDPDIMSRLRFYDPISPPNCPLDLDKSQVIREQERVSFTYEIEFVTSDVRWESRWDAYLEMEGTPVHWFSILISLLTGCVLMMIKKTVNKRVHQAAQLNEKEELPGWRLIIGDVFRKPGHSKLLCVMVGNGVQITATAILTVVFAALGFMSPASPGMLLLGLIVFYLFSGITSGYTGVRLWITMKGTSENWKSVSWSISCFFPGIVLLIQVLLNFIYWGNHSTGAISRYAYLQLLALWFCISVPLTFLGGYLATKAEKTPHPVHTNHVPREITAPTYRSWLLVLVGGSIAFSILFVELFFILSNIWLGRSYNAFGFLLIVLVLLVAVCSQVSVVLTYLRLQAEDWKWWWNAFFASGSVGIFVFSYCAYYLIHDLKGLSGSASAMIYLGYSLIISVAVMLSTGAIGLLTSLYFVRYLYSSLNIDGII